MLPRALGPVACGLACWLAVAGAACAGSFAVSPVRATLSASQPVAALTVRNTGTEPAVVQLELVSWSQLEGEEVYTSTRELLATPPIFTLPAGGTQVVRVGLRRAADAQRELSYRLFLQEVPAPPKPDFQGLRMMLRISLPVFVLPVVAAKPVLRWQANRSPEGALTLSLLNTGNAHVQIANFKLSLPGSAQAWATQQVAEYLLPGQGRVWTVKANPILPPGTALRLFTQTDAGDMDADVVVAP